MTTQTYAANVLNTPSAAVATNGTITFSYPSGQSSSTVQSGAGALMWSEGLQTLLTQGTGNGTFSVAYGGSIVVTYLGTTSIPANTQLIFFAPIPSAGSTITDSTGGTASTVPSVAAITAPAANATTSLTADMTAVKNGLATLIAQHNAIIAALKSANINLP